MRNNYSIDSIKLYVTEKCILDCDYCFVRDKSDDEMNLSIAQKTIDRLLGSLWNYKRIYILWWEPFLKMELITKIIDYARNHNIETKKTLNIIISTSWFISLSKDYLTYLNQNNVVLSFSVDWLKKYHDRHRYLINKLGTYDKILSNISQLDDYNKENLYGVITVYPEPDIVNDIFKSYINLAHNIGFNSIHVSYVLWEKWTHDLQKIYILWIEKILKYIFHEYKKGKFLYLTAFSRYLVWKEISSNNSHCLLKMLEIHTNGDIGHSIWSHYFYDDKRHIDFNVKNIDEWLQLCKSSSECWCHKHKEFSQGDKNIINPVLVKIFERYEKSFWKDYKEYILTYNKYI